MIWPCFGPVGSTEKNLAGYEQFLRAFFSCFLEQIYFFQFLKEYCSVCIKDLHKMKGFFLII